MAEVYLTVDRQLGRQVAVKVIRDRYAEDERFVARFRREARAAAALSHPNVVAVHDVGVHDGSPFIVMEHVPGRTLAEVLRDNGSLRPGRVAEIGEAAARALGAAEIRRATVSGGPYDSVGIVPGPGTTAYVDEDVGPGGTYYYVVKSTTGRRDGPASEQGGVGAPVGCFF